MNHGTLVNLRLSDSTAELTFKTPQGRTQFTDEYHPFFYLTCQEGEEEQVRHYIEGHPLAFRASVEPKYAKPSDPQKTPVVRVEASSRSSFEQLVRDSRKIPGATDAFETRVPHWFKYASSRGLQFSQNYKLPENGETLGHIIKAENPPRTEFVMAAIAPAAKNKTIAILVDGQGMELPASEVNAFLKDSGVDVVFSNGGDEFLTAFSAPGLHSGKHSFFDACQHVDLRLDVGADIYLDLPLELLESGLQELLALGRERMQRLDELCRMTGVSPEVASRVTPGKLNTFLHYQEANARQCLIPDSKKLVERPKTLKELQAMDKGGSIIYPEPGVYRNVGKLDFSSMYPSIIVKDNISPDSLDCKCCTIPGETRFSKDRLCKRKMGLVPAGIRRVLKRRLELKRELKKERDPARRRELDVRQKALKNILVTCFGYLGYNNFVFSNVECKELVMHCGRKVLDQTKLLAEENGLRPVYGVVDSVFLAGGTLEDYQRFAELASKQTGIPLEIDRVFKTIAFPSSRELAGVANKYYGVDEKGELECRGIALRHSDACGLVKEFEEKAARELLSDDGFSEGVARAKKLVRHYIELVMEKRFSIEAYAITKPLHKELSEYVGHSPHVQAFKQAPNAEMVSTFVYTVHGPTPVERTDASEVDARKYAYLLEAALEEMTRGISDKAFIQSRQTT